MWSKAVKRIIIQAKVHTADLILLLSHPEHMWAIRRRLFFFQMADANIYIPLLADSDRYDNTMYP